MIKERLISLGMWLCDRMGMVGWLVGWIVGWINQMLIRVAMLLSAGGGLWLLHEMGDQLVRACCLVEVLSLCAQACDSRSDECN